jgi:predicted lipoprotein with Yx(FWY)xxD motif
MARRSLVSTALVALLAMGAAVAVETAAVADVSSDRATEVPAKKKKKATVKVATTSLGAILVDGKGLTLYAFDPDGTDITASQCTGGCASAWPPLVAKKPRAGKGLDKALLAVGGDNQVAYNGHLLYHFASDTAKGDTFGQGVGGVWHVVGSDGNPIT